MSAFYKNRRRSPEGMPKPVDPTPSGLLRALELELENTQVHKLQAEHVSGPENSIIIKLNASDAQLLSDSMVGSNAAGLKSGDGPYGSYPWVAEVVHVDRAHSAIVVCKNSGEKMPAAGEKFYLYPPDYQLPVRIWAKSLVDQRAKFSESYTNLANNNFTDNEKSPLHTLADMTVDRSLRPNQLKAVHTTGQKFSVIWGPPGTGKTFTLGAAVAALSLLDEKLLVIAPTNAAIDSAVLSIDDARVRLGKPLSDGELVRPGRPQNRILEERRHLMSWDRVLSEASANILCLRDDISDLVRKQQKTIDDKEINVIIQQIGELKVKLAASEQGRAEKLWKLVHDAKIVATTVLSALCHPQVLDGLGGQKVSLFIDEASMVSRFVLPRLLAAEIERLALFGDPKQLGPISQVKGEVVNSKYWVVQSIFDAIGATQDENLRSLEELGKLVLLTEQSRMNAELCKTVSSMFYQNRLVTVGEPVYPPLAPNWPAKACVNVDPSSTVLPKIAPQNKIEVVPTGGGKRFEKSAWIAVAIAEQLLKHKPEASVLLMTPFAEQANLLRMLTAAQLSQYKNVKAGTVHVSQGQEADLVIFDPVSPSHGWFSGCWGRDSMERLLCVAFSRPKTQMIVMGQRKDLIKSPMLNPLCATTEEWAPDFWD